MEIYCPACGKKGRIDDAKIPDSGVFARCPGCRKKLWVNKTDGVSLAEEPSETPPPAQTETAPQHRTEGARGAADPASQPDTPPAPLAPPPLSTSTANVQQPESSIPPDPVPGPVPSTASEEGPGPAAEPQPGTGPSPGEPAHGIPCSVCGNAFADSDMIRFGNTMVCAGCGDRKSVV